MRRYRIIEVNNCDALKPEYATYHYKIQRRFLFVWFDVITDIRYTKTLNDARRWIYLTKQGFKTTGYYYE